MERFAFKLFPVHRHEWPKALMLLGISTLIGMSFSVSRATTEALFLTYFGVEVLPYVLLANPLVILAASAVYGVYADRITNARLLIYTALLPLPLIVLLHGLILLGAHWVYFVLYSLALGYAAILFISWTVYLAEHYDTQEAKRLVPLITSGQLLGGMLGGASAALCAPLFGAANVLLVWLGTLLGVAGAVWRVARHYTAPDTGSRHRKPRAKPPGIWQNFTAGLGFVRSSSLVLATTVVTITAMILAQLLDYQYSRIFAQAYPEPEALTAFLGMFDACATLVALLVQWFVAPWCLRRWRVQGTNLLFPYTLTAVFAGVALLPTFGTAMAARGTRIGLMPSLRGTTQALILNAVPRKMAARIRNFNVGMAVPVGLWLGACLLVFLKGVTLPLLFPTLGILISLSFVYFSHRQSAAYGEALLSLLREDKIHLLDLHDDDLRHLDATAVATIGERLRREQSNMQRVAAQAGVSEPQQSDMPGPHEEASLAAIALLRKIGSAEAGAVLQQHLPFASPRLTAAALEAIAALGGRAAHGCLRAYLGDAQPAVRLAAFTGLSQLGEPTLHDQAVAFLEDADAQVRAAALAVILAVPTSPATARAQQVWHAMLGASDPSTQIAALSIIPAVPDASGLALASQALGHAHSAVRLEALHILQQLAAAGRLRQVEPTLLAALADEDMEVREGALQVLAAFGNAGFLEHLLVLLDDDHPRVRESLVRRLKPFGRRAMAPLLARLQAPHTSLRSKETALWALAQLDGVPVAALVPFWERALRDVYQYKLMLTRLTPQEASLPDDTFLRVALQDQHDQLLTLLLHLFAVWVSPEVARLVESGLRDTDRYQRAQALEALESLGERRFTRLLLPLLETTDEPTSTWQEVARQQWHLVCPEVHSVIDTCLQAMDKWVVIGALLAGNARATTMGDDWQQRLAQLAASAADTHIQRTAQQLLGYKVVQPYQHLSLTDVMLFLKRIPLYNSLSLEQIHTMARHLTEQVAWPGKTIVQEGEHSDEFYLIVTGKVEIVKGYGDTTVTLASLSAGDFFGEMAIFEQLPRVASAIAVEESVLLVLSALHFRRLIMQNPAISFGLFRELSARLRHFQDEHWYHAA